MKIDIEDILEKESYQNIVNINTIDFKNVVVQKYRKGLISKDEILKMINNLIYIDINKASVILDKTLDNNSISYIILKNKINERMYYLSLEENRKNMYDRCLKVGRYALEIHEYETAYYYFTAGKYVANNPIFYYYIGKTFYKMKRFSKAKEYFEIYNLIGGEKIEKNTFYLLKIAEKCENSNYYSAMYKKLKVLKSILKSDFCVRSGYSMRKINRHE